MTKVFGDIAICYPALLAGALVILIIAILWRLRTRGIRYRWPLAQFVAQQGGRIHSNKPRLLFFLRVCTAALAALLAARVVSSKISQNLFIDAVDIILVLDCSGSMEALDDPYKDPRSRFDVARDVALEFVKKRKNDQIGLVNFATEAVTRAPLTLDKNILDFCLRQMSIGQIDANYTNIAAALGLALARLSGSTAKSKIIILLTDGQPTKEPRDFSIEKAKAIAKEKGVKIYTVGVNGQDGLTHIRDPRTGQLVAVRAAIDPELLASISKETGAKSYLARNPREMETAYNEIDKLEKTKVKTPFLFNHRDLFWPLFLPLLVCLGLHSLLALLWRGIW